MENMNDLFPVFNYQGNQVRTIIENGEPLFVAKDVCDILDLGDVSRAVGRLDDDEKGTSSIRTLGGQQEMLTVNEPGLYSLIFASRKPEAKQFKRLVYHEILPSIRKTGQYGDQKLYLRRVQLDTKKLQIEAETMRLSFLDSVKDRLSSSELVSLASSIMGNAQPRQVQRMPKIAMMDAGWMIDFTAFLNDCCILSEKLICETSALYDEYVKWAQKNGEPVRTRTKFGRTLAQKGFEKERTGTGRVARRGIGVRIAEKGGEA
jgi:prophage antirepressor-like protein